MASLAIRHWTAILIAVAVAAWAVFYVPQTPSWMIFQLKQAIDARDGDGAARYVDFLSVVRHAGSEMANDQSNSNPGASGVLGALISNGVVNLLAGPMASALKSQAVQEVDNGAKQMQIPSAAALGAIALMHRNGDAAYTRWTDNKGQVWEVRLAREPDGWKIVEVKNIEQLLQKLEQQQENRLNPPPEAMPSAPGGNEAEPSPAGP
jgi:hypothetical protein